MPGRGKDSHKAQEMTLLSEDDTSLVLGMPVSLFLYSNQEKEKIAVKLEQISEAALALQLPAKECSGGVKAASLPSVMWEKETCSPAAEPRHAPREGRFVPLYRNIFCCGGGCGASFPDPDSSKTNSWADCWLVKKVS